MDTEIKKKIIEKNQQWNLRRVNSKLAPANGNSLSPNGRWLILEYGFHQEPEDRYESEIDDEEYIIFDLKQTNPEIEVGRFRFYYNYNSCADWKEITGSRFKWGDGAANLILGETVINLEELSYPEILSILERFNY